MRIEKNVKGGWTLVTPFNDKKAYPTLDAAKKAARDFKPYCSQLFRFGELKKGERFEVVNNNKTHSLELIGVSNNSLLLKDLSTARIYKPSQYGKDVLKLKTLGAEQIRRVKTGLTLEATKMEFLKREECNIEVENDENDKQRDLYAIDGFVTTETSVADKFLNDNANLTEAVVRGLTNHSCYDTFEEYEKIELLQSSVLCIQELILNMTSRVRN